MLTTFYCYIALVSGLSHKNLDTPVQRIKLMFTEGDIEDFNKEYNYPKNIKKAVCEHLEFSIELAHPAG